MAETTEDIFLIGETDHQIIGDQLPSNLQVLRFLFHNIRVLGHNLRDSKSLVYDELITFWLKVKIPTQQKSRCTRKIEDLYNEWRSLQKHSSRQDDTQKNKEREFSSHLNDLFDIAHNDALTMIHSNTRRFLINQRKPNRVGFIDAIEEITSESSEATPQFESPQTNSSGQDSAQYDPCVAAGSDNSPASKRYRGTIDFLTPKLCTMLDKCQISDRHATCLLISFLEAVNLDASQYIVNRTSIKQKREKFRENRAAEIQMRFKNTELCRVIIHWDGKYLPDATGRSIVERLPVIISSETGTKILSIPQLENSTGRSMANAVVDAIQENGISDVVVGLCCDTTPSNTGEYNGAAVLIEQSLGKDLLLFPCRHHIFEVILKAVFDSGIFNSSGPAVPLFVRFKKEWDTLDLNKFKSGITDPTINEILENEICDLHDFIKKQLTLNHNRCDYLELLELSLMFIGITPENVTFHVPGAMHQARWLAKAIYSLKIFLLRATFKLKPTEEKNLAMICVFIVKIYLRIWFTASSSVKAPNSDFQLIKSIHSFQSIDKKISEAALSKICNHLWYLNPENCLLSLFDENVNDETKQKMITKLFDYSDNTDGVDLSDDSFFRVRKKVLISKTGVEKLLEGGLEQFVMPSSISFFHKLKLNTSWLKENVQKWSGNSDYQKCLNAVSNLPVVNDVAERGVKLMQEYNNSFTKDENQKQFVIQILDDYRRKNLKNTKESLIGQWN